MQKTRGACTSTSCRHKDDATTRVRTSVSYNGPQFDRETSLVERRSEAFTRENNLKILRSCIAMLEARARLHQQDSDARTQGVEFLCSETGFIQLPNPCLRNSVPYSIQEIRQRLSRILIQVDVNG